MGAHVSQPLERNWPRGTRLLDRFVIERRLGQGGMGVVYAALDEKRGERVALKTLGRVDGGSVYRLKKEFRALADLVHPNLVRLHELFSDDESWFFTMARVDGTPFTTYARIGGIDDDGASDPTASTIVPRAPELRRALSQLAAGVRAIHRFGKIHRDLKPANVLVGSDGHVTILDFGLVEPVARDAEQSVELAGTPAYMAPEQIREGGACEASDWYAVGMMLYEVLAGRLPFVGSSREVLVQKLAAASVAPLPNVAADLRDLADLALALLRTEPHERPRPDEIVARLGASASDAEDIVPSEPAPKRAFVGREAELARLQAAYDAMRAGATSIVWVEGVSGIGKSALVEHFVNELRWRGSSSETIVLVGRCYERESVPFKAVDAVIDALSRHLRRIDRVAAARTTPRDLAELCRVFPVLGRVPVFAETDRARTAATDPEVVRRKAFVALKEIFARLALERPLVITIDDLQWGDVDSGLVLAHLTSPPDPPPLLLIGTYRAEDVDRSPLLRQLREQAKHEGEMRIERLVLGALDEAGAAELARRHGVDTERAQRIAAESGGSPFFVTELARAEDATGNASIAEIVAARVARLPRDAQRLLEVVAIAGEPVAVQAALRAAGLDQSDDAAIPILRTRSFLRATGGALETYHDKIREVVAERVSSDRAKELHGMLANALAALPETSPDALYMHCEAAGRKDEARKHAVAAARRARETLAFDRAAFLYERALDDIATRGGSETRALQRELADALALAGRGDEAAKVYLRLAENASEDESLELERLAAIELVSRGDLDRGLALVDQISARVGVWVPQSAFVAALLGSLTLVIYLWRGIVPSQKTSAIDGKLVRKFDVLYSLVTSLAMIEAPRSVLLMGRAMKSALRAGDSTRLPLVYWTASVAVSSFVRADHPRIAEWMRMGRDLALEGDEHSGRHLRAAAMVALLGGDWRRARDYAKEADSFVEHRPGRAPELNSSLVAGTLAEFYLGNLRIYGDRCLTFAREARARRNPYMLNAMVNTFGPIAHLARDDVRTAKRESEDAIAAWPGKRFQLQHSWLLLAHGCIELYAGDGVELHERVEASWPTLVGSGVLFSRLVATQMFHLRAAACVAKAAVHSDRSRLLAAAERHAKKVASRHVHGCAPLASSIRSACAHLRGEKQLALDELDVAIAGFEKAEMRAYAMAAKRHLGKLRGDEALVKEADAFFTNEGVARPDRFAAMFAPGFG